ncbi:MAG TPA: FlgO family outer membrane protein [Gemmatimonadaceae bacterium]|nr:FlgO family outer membrane protein [Gemmatimonadaceae bacterium]
MQRAASLVLCLAIVSAAGPAHAQAAPATTTVPKKTVAILYFDNYTGQSDYDALGKGISSMMISDLSSVQEIQLVERDRMQDLLKEMELQHSKYFDSTTALKAGKMVGAQYVVVGAFAAVNPQMRIDTRVVKVETGEIVKTAQVTGDQNKFFDLEQKLADRLVDGLGLALSPEEQAKLAAQEQADRIDALSTVEAFSQALSYYDKKDYDNAMSHMTPVVTKAPNSMVVKVAFDEIKAHAAQSAADKAKDKVKSMLPGFRRPPIH